MTYNAIIVIITITFKELYILITTTGFLGRITFLCCMSSKIPDTLSYVSDVLQIN